MQNCEMYQALMLDSLYDLLEEAEQQSLRAHLEACPACQAEMARARQQQSLLAAAARMEFPDIQFRAPQETQTATLPLRAASPRRLHLRRWLVAAVLLLTLGGLAAAGAWYGHDYLQAQRLVQTQTEALAQARTLFESAQSALRTLPREYQEKREKAQRELTEQQLRVMVTGKTTVVAGAPADFQVETTNFASQPVNVQVSAQMLDHGQPAGKEVDGVALAPGRYRVTLPPDLPIRPGSRPTLVVRARRAGGAHAELREELALDAPVYMTHLAIDKPMYQPGETIHFRSLTLDRASLRPGPTDLHLLYSLTLPNGVQVPLVQGSSMLARPDNAVVKGPDGKPLGGIGAGEYVLPPDSPGGEYTLSVREDQGRFPEQKRKFLVNNYQKPRLNKELDFNRTTYGPGDEVAALCKVRTADNRPLKNAPVMASVQIDGHTYDAAGRESGQPLRLQTDADGKVTVRFQLPAQIERGQASLTVTFEDEPLVKPIPMVLKKLQMNFYPEGGYLVAALPNRVYFEVRTPLDKPAEIQGRLLEDGKPLPVAVQTAHDDHEPGVNKGLGLFEFTPQAGRKYEVEVERPTGITQRFGLPAVETDRVILSIPPGVFGADKAIPIILRSAHRGSYLVGAYCRGRLLDTTQVEPIHFDARGTARVELHPAAPAGGVCRVTVFEVQGEEKDHRQLRPVAERLIYRQPAERLDLKLTPDRDAYVPRQGVKLDVSATNEKGEPAPAAVLLAVVDKSVVTLADDKTVRAMPTHFLLTTEVRHPEDLEYADFLLGKHPRAAEVLDLLLGTQGWRRFAEQDPEKFRQQQPEEGERLLVMTGQSMNKITDLTQAQQERIEREMVARREELTEQRDQAYRQDREARDNPAYKAALIKLANYDDFFDKTRRLGPPSAGLVLLVVAVALLLVAAQRRRSTAWSVYAGLAGSALGLLLVGTLYLEHRGGGHAEVAQGPVSPPLPALAVEETGQPLNPLDDADVGGPNTRAPLGRLGEMAGGVGGVPRGAGAPRVAMPMAVGRAVAVPPPPGPPVPPPAVNRAVDPAVVPQRAELRQEAAKILPLQARDLKEAQLKKQEKADKDAAMDQPVEQGRRQAFGGRGALRGQGMARLQPPGGPMASPVAVGPNPQPLVVREYAHRADTGDSGPRRDETETLFWDPVLILPNGKAQASFDLSDSITSFEVTAFAHTLDGRIGAATRLIESRLPVTLTPKTPLEVTASDHIELPLTLSNATDQPQQVRIALHGHDNLDLLKGSDGEVSVAPQGMARRFYHFRPRGQEGLARVHFEGQAGPLIKDQVERSFRIVPEGFPIVAAHSDLLEGSATTTLTLPSTWIAGTLRCQASVYPSTLADLQKGLEAMLQEPGGCFEQTSTTNYPNVLVLDYLRESNQARPEIERRARELLSHGYEHLTSFECLDTSHNARRGYEWFGGTAPAHEALTAYGLMEFRDMARVQDVDAAMLKRTHDYLLSRRDGKGGFLRNPQALDSFGAAPEDITNAYIVWAMTESGKDDDVTRELDALSKKAAGSNDPYFLSLVANSLINRARTADGAALLRKVAAVQKEDGHLDGQSTSITHSAGSDLQIETTALAVLGWLKANPAEFHQPLSRAIRWIGQQRGGAGSFGSTQATILALKALIAYTKANKRTAEAGTLQLFVNDRSVARLDFPAGASDALELAMPQAEQLLQPGKNKVRVEITGKNTFPYTLSWSYRTLQPASAEGCAVRMETSLARSEVREGESVRLNVRLTNVSGKGQGMAVAIVGLPAGLGLPEDLKQLKDYVRVPMDGSRPLLGAFEVRGRELVLYWRDLAPEQKIEVPVDLVCRVPGEYSGPASRGYLYYNADHKHWVAPLKVKVLAGE